MTTTIAIAGATGNLGGRIIQALVARGAEVRALVRPGADAAKLQKLDLPGVKVIKVALPDQATLTSALEGVSCVVSALQGLRDVIVVDQSTLLAAAVAAKVPRFIPSDYASDFHQLKEGDNRNFDLRREFDLVLDKAAIAGTSIFNGAFAEILGYGVPMLDLKAKRVGYWGDENWRVDFTTIDDIAAFTAAAAMDSATPRILRIAGFQISAAELAALAIELSKGTFTLARIGSLDDLAAHNRKERAAHPEGETNVFPDWQRGQYMHSMFSTKLEPLDNARYPNLKWKGARDVVAGLLARG